MCDTVSLFALYRDRLVVAVPLHTDLTMMDSTSRLMMVVEEVGDSNPVADENGTAATGMMRDGIDDRLPLTRLDQKYTSAECRKSIRVELQPGMPPCLSSSHFPDDGRQIRL